MGLRVSAKSDSSRLYNRTYYGYAHDDDVYLVIHPGQAEVIWLIFEFYISEYSVLEIIRELETRGIPSPTGKETWYKRSNETMFSNAKYTSAAIFLKFNSL